MSVHIVQIDPRLPEQMSCVTWESTAPALYGVFVPVSNAVTKISDAYSRNQPAEEAGQFDTGIYPWFTFKALNTLCVEKNAQQAYGLPVRQYWHQAETDMIAGMASLLGSAASEDPESAAKRITAYCCSLQEQAFSDAQSLLNDVRWNMAKNSNTLRNGINPETHEILDELKTIQPIKVSPDVSVYKKIATE